jgi:hypothetical protein
VTWVESATRSFRARHDAADRDDAQRVLDSLEVAREELAGYFPASLAGLTVVLRSQLKRLAGPSYPTS